MTLYTAIIVTFAFSPLVLALLWLAWEAITGGTAGMTDVWLLDVIGGLLGLGAVVFGLLWVVGFVVRWLAGW